MASALGYDTSVKNNLWQDRVNTEVNLAVLHSYNSAGVAIVDHHTLVILSFYNKHSQKNLISFKNIRVGSFLFGIAQGIKFHFYSVIFHKGIFNLLILSTISKSFASLNIGEQYLHIIAVSLNMTISLKGFPSIFSFLIYKAH